MTDKRAAKRALQQTAELLYAAAAPLHDCHRRQLRLSVMPQNT